MRQINRTPSIIAVCWGLALLAMMPAANVLMRPQGVTVTWTALMWAEGALIILCAWAQLASSPDAWTRMLAIISCAMALYIGTDLNEARDAQLAYDNPGGYEIQLASNGTAPSAVTALHSHKKNGP